MSLSVKQLWQDRTPSFFCSNPSGLESPLDFADNHESLRQSPRLGIPVEVNTPNRPSMRITCPSCGGKVKLPPYQAGQRCGCPRCGAEIVVPGPDNTSAVETPRATATGNADEAAQAPAAEAAPRATAKRTAVSYEDVYGISCQVCQTRLHVRPHQAGTSIKCPDCFSQVLVPPAPKRRQLPQAARPLAQDDPSVGSPTGVQTETQKLLEKARAELERAEAQEREESPDRFTEGLFDFLIDVRSAVWLAVLAYWFSVAMWLTRWAMSLQIPEAGLAVLSQTLSLIVGLFAVGLLLSFLVATAAWGWALVRDTSEGLRKIARWPGVNVLAWDRDLRYVLGAGIVAAFPGALVGVLLGWIAIKGLMLYTAAATFAGLFPLVLLSMRQSGSVTVPFSEGAWGSIADHPAPWNLTYLMTIVLVILGLFGTVTAIQHGGLLGLAGALLMAFCMALYFRTVGRLLGHLDDLGRET
jgi:DNA-directed RNA polymerase subunit RPC12/RpoP